MPPGPESWAFRFLNFIASNATVFILCPRTGILFRGRLSRRWWRRRIRSLPTFAFSLRSRLYAFNTGYFLSQQIILITIRVSSQKLQLTINVFLTEDTSYVYVFEEEVGVDIVTVLECLLTVAKRKTVKTKTESPNCNQLDDSVLVLVQKLRWPFR